MKKKQIAFVNPMAIPLAIILGLNCINREVEKRETEG